MLSALPLHFMPMHGMLILACGTTFRLSSDYLKESGLWNAPQASGSQPDPLFRGEGPRAEHEKNEAMTIIDEAGDNQPGRSGPTS